MAQTCAAAQKRQLTSAYLKVYTVVGNMALDTIGLTSLKRQFQSIELRRTQLCNLYPTKMLHAMEITRQIW